MFHRLWLLTLLCMLPLIGCGPSNDATKNGTPKPNEKPETKTPTDKAGDPPPAKPELTKGGQKPAQDDTLVLLYADDPDTLNVITSNDTVSQAFHRQVYQFLAQRSFPDPDKWEPQLAESWEFDEKTLTYTIKLRKGVYWHPMKLPNGKELPKTEFTSADVKFTFDCILNENIEGASIRSYYQDTDAKDDSAQKFKIKVTVVDDYTVKVQWLKPYFLAMDYTFFGSQIMPRHVYGVDKDGEPISLDYRGSKDFADAFNNHWANTKMCGTGPLIFKEWKKNEGVTFERNPDYWGEPYYFSSLEYRNVKNPNTALQLTLNGELDMGAIPQKDHYVQSKDHANVKSGKVELFEFDYPAYRYLGYNVRRDLFKDKRVRMAISQAIPIDEIIEKVYFNLATRLTGPFLPGSSANDSSLPPIAFDLDKARALLDEAGWKDEDGDGIRESTIAGKQVDAKFELMIYSSSPQYQQIGELIKENCRRLGVEVTVTPTEWALMLQRLRKKEFDATILGWALDWKMDPFQIFHGSQADLPESSNAGGYANPEVDKLIEELRVTMDEAKQTEIFHQMHKLLYDDQPYTFLFVDKQTAGRNSRIENMNLYRIRPCYDSREWTASAPRTGK
jgi:ABC-type transport system substrate-binding protein